MPIVYGKIRVLNMAKSAKTRAENLGEPCEEIREFWSLEGSVSLNPLRKKENPPSLTKFFYFIKNLNG
jgi:hypothetical protein